MTNYKKNFRKQFKKFTKEFTLEEDTKNKEKQSSNKFGIISSRKYSNLSNQTQTISKLNIKLNYVNIFQ